MHYRTHSFPLIIGLIILSVLTASRPGGATDHLRAGRTHPVLVVEGVEDDREANRQILVELFLSKERKHDLEAIKKRLEAVSITRVRAQFFRLGNPPQIIAIGKNVPASVARLAIELAITYNRGVTLLLPQFHLPHNYIAIGTSAFDEASQVPIRPEDLTRLSDPSLTTQEFHTLYRLLTKDTLSH